MLNSHEAELTLRHVVLQAEAFSKGIQFNKILNKKYPLDLTIFSSYLYVVTYKISKPNL